MEERYHATTQNRFYPDMSNVNKNITVEAKLISPPTYIYCCVGIGIISESKLLYFRTYDMCQTIVLRLWKRVKK